MNMSYSNWWSPGHKPASMYKSGSNVRSQLLHVNGWLYKVGNCQDIRRAFKQCLETSKRENKDSGKKKIDHYNKKELAIKGKHQGWQFIHSDNIYCMPPSKKDLDPMLQELAIQWER